MSNHSLRKLKMNTKQLISLCPAFLLIVMSASAATVSGPAVGTYQIDPAHSKVGFEIQHLVISTVEGKFKTFSGTIEVAKPFTASKLKAEADVTSVDTGVEKRDNHLKSAEFFDAEKFPKMTFEGTSISGTPANFKMKGNLTLKGVTKPVTFDSQYLGSAPDGYGNIKAVFNAKTKISRKDFGLNWNSLVEKAPVVGDMVSLDLKIEAATPAPKSESEKH